MDVTYDPPKEENDEDAGITVTVQNDSNTALVVPVQGNGVDPCFGVVCDAGVTPEPGSSNPGGCFGTCQAGKCVFAGPCSDQTQCLSNGMCNPSTGACQGTSNCAVAGAGTCNGNKLTGDVPPGTCDQGTGKCLYNTEHRHLRLRLRPERLQRELQLPVGAGAGHPHRRGRERLVGRAD